MADQRAKLQQLIHTTNTASAKSVLLTLLSNLREIIPEHAHLAYEDVFSKLKKDAPDTCGYLEMQIDASVKPFNDGDKLHVSLASYKKGTKQNIFVPEPYVNDVLHYCDQIKKMAQAYWEQYIIDNPEFYNRIKLLTEECDFSKLTPDTQNPLSMYFLPNSTDRVLVVCYYVDKNGNIFNPTPR